VSSVTELRKSVPDNQNRVLKAMIERERVDVRFGSLADIAAALPNVRFAPKDG
jgi:hypothetical protein